MEIDWTSRFREFTGSLNWFLANRRDLVEDVVHQTKHEGKQCHVLTIVNDNQLARCA